MLLIEKFYGRNFLKSVISLQISKSCINYTVVVSWCPYAISWKMDPHILQHYLLYNGRFKNVLKISWACCNAPLPAFVWCGSCSRRSSFHNSVPSLPDTISKCSLSSLFPSSLFSMKIFLSGVCPFSSSPFSRRTERNECLFTMHFLRGDLCLICLFFHATLLQRRS